MGGGIKQCFLHHFSSNLEILLMNKVHRSKYCAVILIWFSFLDLSPKRIFGIQGNFTLSLGTNEENSLSVYIWLAYSTNLYPCKGRISPSSCHKGSSLGTIKQGKGLGLLWGISKIRIERYIIASTAREVRSTSRTK